MRLDQYIAKQLGMTRNQARAAIKRGVVRVDGEVVRKHGQHVVPEGDGAAVVTIGERRVHYSEHVTLMLHKPVGVVTATRDASHKTVFDLRGLSNHPRKRDLVAVGRLDKDTTGLLLLTTDGALVQYLMHPKRGVVKRYRAAIDGALHPNAGAWFDKGIELRDDTTCRPARLEVLSAREVIVEVHEGRYHQVKRMLAACGAKVTALHRESLGGLTLGDLKPGEMRPLSDAEIPNPG